MKCQIVLALLLTTTCLVHANIGDTSEEIKKRFGKQDRTQATDGLTKLEWNNFKGYRLRVYMTYRNRKLICIREEYRLQDGKLMNKTVAKKIIDGYLRKKKDQWKFLNKSTQVKRGTLVTVQNMHFSGKNGIFAIYSRTKDGSELTKEADNKAYVVFMDVVAYADYNKQFVTTAPKTH